MLGDATVMALCVKTSTLKEIFAFSSWERWHSVRGRGMHEYAFTRAACKESASHMIHSLPGEEVHASSSPDSTKMQDFELQLHRNIGDDS
jgi:hypothetical protein